MQKRRRRFVQAQVQVFYFLFEKVRTSSETVGQPSSSRGSTVLYPATTHSTSMRSSRPPDFSTILATTGDADADADADTNADADTDADADSDRLFDGWAS